MLKTVVAKNNHALEEKLIHLMAEKEKSLGVSVLCRSKSKYGDVHLICHRHVDNSFIVWTSYCTNNLNTSYENFFNGYYDATLKEAMCELEKRLTNN